MTSPGRMRRRIDGSGTWMRAEAYAAPISIFVLALFFYWFAVADRYVVFLYYHDMGSLYPDTSPFSALTSSRYWMAGLVASGAVMVFYASVNWILGRLISRYRPPAWWRVWVLCVLSLVVAIPLITMAVNQPTLRVLDAAYTTVAVLIGLALALLPGAMAAKRPGELTWLALDGTALMLVLLSLVGLERLERWLASGRVWWVWMTVIVAMLGVLALIGVTLLRTRRRTPVPSAAAVFLAGLCVAYLLMPLMHHVMGTDGYYYISDSDNFFAGNVALRFAVWLIAAALAVGVTRLRKHLEERRPFAAS